MSSTSFFEHLTVDFHASYKTSEQRPNLVNHIHDKLEVTFILTPGATAMITRRPSKCRPGRCCC